MKNAKTFQIISYCLLCLGLHSCNAYLNQPMKTRQARIGEETTMTQESRQLPQPADKLVVAVYKFRDQTGQYKASDNGANWSTAVTQGATNILLKSLEDSGWFIPIERENVSNLLNERKIIRSSRQQYLGDANQQKAQLPPLLYGGIILEGGIVSYDANVITGGAGMRYFGMGGSGQYRQDRVTVYLRAISTQSGKILKTVYTSKTVLSQTVDVGLFQFVRFKRLLEIETGFTYNEPSELVVTEAIEKAVQSLILEGLIAGHWNAAEEEKGQAAVAIADYQKEKTEMRHTDLFNFKAQPPSGKFALQMSAMALRYEGDYALPQIRPGWEMGFSSRFHPRWSTHLNLGTGQLASEEFFRQNLAYVDLQMQYRFLPQHRFSPFLLAGAGLIGNTRNTPFEFTGDQYFKLQGGFGLEFLWKDRWGFQLTFDQNQLLSDQIDALPYGKFNDYFWRMKIGVVTYLGQ